MYRMKETRAERGRSVAEMEEVDLAPGIPYL